MNINKLLTALLIVSFAAVSYAAPVPNIGDALKQVEPPQDIPKQQRPLPELKENLRPQMKMTDQRTMLVKGFTVSGNTAISTEVLTTIANKPENINRELTLAEINAVAETLTKYYRDNGYFVAKAYVPKQEIIDGIIEIVILEGEYGSVNVDNKSLVSSKRINGIIGKMTDGKIIKAEDVERQMILVNKTPGANLNKINIKPGDEFGTSSFDISVIATPRVYGYVIGDNYGLRYTGPNRAMAGVGINSPFGMGDRLFISGITSTTGGLKNGRAAYKLPLTSSGLTGEISYSKTAYSLEEEYDSLDATGDSDTIEMEFSYPLILSKFESAYATLAFTSRQMKDEIELFDSVDEKDTLSAKAGISYKKVYPLFGFRYTTELKAAYTVGTLDFDNSEAEDIDEQGADTQGTYHKLTGTAKQKIEFTPRWSLTASLQAQHVLNDKNLDGSEDLSIGGAYGVRVFPSSEQSAENGYILNAELFYRLPDVNKLVTMVSVFGDTAYVKPQDDFSDEGGRSLSDVGAGFYAYYKTFFMKSYFAYAVGGAKVESEPEYNSRLLVQAGMTF
jgi:hemolysin activation/secretion protein